MHNSNVISSLGIGMVNEEQSPPKNVVAGKPCFLYGDRASAKREWRMEVCMLECTPSLNWPEVVSEGERLLVRTEFVGDEGVMLLLCSGHTHFASLMHSGNQCTCTLDDKMTRGME